MFKPLVSDRLSWFRTEHRFLNFTEIANHDDYQNVISNQDAAKQLVMLGNGSNCLFARKTIKSFIVKNKLPKETVWKNKHQLWASSSVPLMLILKECKKHRLDSFYYLSSVPATVGGAIAMNAGRGPKHNKTIFDFVKQVDVWTPTGPVSFSKSDLKIEHRHTIFIDQPNWFITGVLFEFADTLSIDSENPIATRVKYSQEIQDHSGPNCGSVFKQFYPSILRRLRGTGFKGASFSGKTTNWIVNHSKSSLGICFLIRLAKFLHVCFRKKCKLEIRIIK